MKTPLHFALSLQQAGPAGGENVVGIDRRVRIIKNEIASENVVARALHPVHPADYLVFIARVRNSIGDPATRVA